MYLEDNNKIMKELQETINLFPELRFGQILHVLGLFKTDHSLFNEEPSVTYERIKQTKEAHKYIEKVCDYINRYKAFLPFFRNYIITPNNIISIKEQDNTLNILIKINDYEWPVSLSLEDFIKNYK